MKISDAIFGFLLLAIGGAVLLAIRSYPTIPGQQVGPALFPGLIATGLCVGGLILLVKGLRHRLQARWIEPGEWIRSARHIASFAALIGAILFYMVASEFLGFLIISSLILLGLFLVLQVEPLRAVAIAVLVSLLIHFMFYKLLRVPLPWGLLKNYAW